jgi:hypothetical protein
MNLNPHIRPLWAISLEAAYAEDMAAQGRYQEQQSRGIRDGPTAPHRPTRPGDTYGAMQNRLERGDREVDPDLDAAVVPIGEAWRIAQRRDSGARPVGVGRLPSQPGGDLPGGRHVLRGGRR